MKVLVVDDSAVMRQLMSALLSAEGDVEVMVAADPIIAWRKMARSQPDVILLDLELPRVDGITFLQQVMARAPTPVVVCSGHVGEGSELAFRALEHGAVGVVPKPRSGLREFLERSSGQVVEAVRAAAATRSHLRGRTGMLATAPGQARRLKWGNRAVEPEALLALGASSGGPEALRFILESLPAQSPPIVVVQHMPAAFTSAFAKRLASTSALDVREARAGDVLSNGVVLIAPGDRHLEVRRRNGVYVAELDEGPAVSGHRPSVDVLFASVACAAGRHAVAAILTGMGADGVNSLLELKRVGAHTIAQDRATSAIFGMPRVAVERGAALEVLGLPAIPAALLRACRR